MGSSLLTVFHSFSLALFYPHWHVLLPLKTTHTYTGPAGPDSPEGCPDRPSWSTPQSSVRRGRTG